jgi:hypothetical protein
MAGHHSGSAIAAVAVKQEHDANKQNKRKGE